MYQIKRNHIVEELEIEDNGKVLHLDVDISVDEIIREYITARVRMQGASQAAKMAKNENDLGKAEEAMGDAVISLFNIVFGQDNTKKILDFYDGKYIAMLEEISPFILEVVEPRVIEAQKRIEDRYKQVAKRGK